MIAYINFECPRLQKLQIRPSLNKLCRARVPNAGYQVSRSSVIRFLKRKFSKVFTMDRAAIWIMWPRHYEQTFVPLPHGDSTYNLVLNDRFQRIFRLKMLTPTSTPTPTTDHCLSYKLHTPVYLLSVNAVNPLGNHFAIFHGNVLKILQKLTSSKL